MDEDSLFAFYYATCRDERRHAYVSRMQADSETGLGAANDKEFDGIVMSNILADRIRRRWTSAQQENWEKRPYVERSVFLLAQSYLLRLRRFHGSQIDDTATIENFQGNFHDNYSFKQVVSFWHYAATQFAARRRFLDNISAYVAQAYDQEENRVSSPVNHEALYATVKAVEHSIEHERRVSSEATNYARRNGYDAPIDLSDNAQWRQPTNSKPVFDMNALERQCPGFVVTPYDRAANDFLHYVNFHTADHREEKKTSSKKCIADFMSEISIATWFANKKERQYRQPLFLNGTFFSPEPYKYDYVEGIQGVYRFASDIQWQWFYGTMTADPRDFMRANRFDNAKEVTRRQERSRQLPLPTVRRFNRAALTQLGNAYSLYMSNVRDNKRWHRHSRMLSQMYDEHSERDLCLLVIECWSQEMWLNLTYQEQQRYKWGDLKHHYNQAGLARDFLEFLQSNNKGVLPSVQGQTFTFAQAYKLVECGEVFSQSKNTVSMTVPDSFPARQENIEQLWHAAEQQSQEDTQRTQILTEYNIPTYNDHSS